MGRAKPGMEDERPITDACEMPRFISSFDEGRVKVSRNSTETSLSDGKVERPTGDLNRRVTRSNSWLSFCGGDPESEERSDSEERDAEGNNNNNCNGGARAGRRASAVDVLRRNFSDSKSNSFHFNSQSRMNCEVEREKTEGSIFDDVTDGHDACEKPDRETGEPGVENEPTPSDLKTLDFKEVEYLPVTHQCHQICDNVGSTSTLNECFRAKEHVSCTVYCIANDPYRTDTEITDSHDDTVMSGATEIDVETGQVVDTGSEPALYTLEDLVDPFVFISHRLYGEQAGAESEIQFCRVCLEDKTIASLPCCRKAVCDECLKLYVSTQVRMGKALINCPIPECNGTLAEGLVVSHLTKEEVAKYHYFLELSHLDSSTKPCPQCNHFTSLKSQNHNRSEHKYKIQCSNCQFLWCFKCHAPWHNGLKCRDYRKGDKLLRTWASVIEHGQRNAQKCPHCKIHIQRTEGCDHMTCTQCNTNFCYRCGERYRHLRFFGDHTSNLSVFGCKYRYLPDKPHLRRLVRGSVCATKVLIAPLVLLLVIVLGALALVIGLVAFPVYYICKRRKKQRDRGSGHWI